VLRSQADHTYGYAEALADGVVRPVVFLAYSGQARWRDSAGEEHAARLGEPLSADQTARAWRTALDPAGEWMPAVITAADERLRQLRTHVPDAGGMIIASDQTAARAYAALLTKLTFQAPTVVLSDDPGSSARISEFAESTGRWLVAVRMVSEGVDVPRLAVGIYATSASTPLFFAQAIGRFVRSRRPGETASIFVPSVPNLLQLASELEAQRNHVLGQPHRDAEDPLDGDPAVRTQTDKGETDKGFTALGADAELDQVIFDGSSFGTATPAGSDEEADYLGIPGLLDAEQMRALLHRRQDEQLRKRAQRQGQAAQGAPHAPPSMHGQLRDLRRELNTLVSATHHRTGKPHGWIHSELRRRCGGPPIAAATREQLQERIVALRQLNSEQSR
jgi:superfamily II DNA or RNA helicase